MGRKSRLKREMRENPRRFQLEPLTLRGRAIWYGGTCAFIGLLLCAPAMMPLVLAPFHGPRTRDAIVVEVAVITASMVLAGAVVGVLWALPWPRNGERRTLAGALGGVCVAAILGTSIGYLKDVTPGAGFWAVMLAVGALCGAIAVNPRDYR